MKEYQITFDEQFPPRKKVAIVGFSESTLDLAPYHDPEWAIVGENQLYRFLPRATRWYEMHKDYLSDEVKGTDYKKWLRECPIPIMMVEAHSEYPASVRYPIEERVAQFGEVFTSSVAYMLADAIAEGAEEIGVYGIDMIHETEYGYQKPACMMLLSYAMAKGIKVTIPEDSALLKMYGKSKWRYGYEDVPFDQWEPVLNERKAAIANNLLAAQQQLARWTGAEEERTYWASVHEREMKGGALAGRRPIPPTSS